MAEPMAAPKPADKIIRSGPRPLATLLPALTKPAFRSRNAASAQLLADWPLIVGPILAASTMPLRLSAGTLTLSCAGPVALELQHLTAPLAERINAHFGRILVERFRFVQAQTTALPPAPPRSPPPPTPVPVPDLPDGPLRDALSKLGGAVAQACLTRPREAGA